MATKEAANYYLHGAGQATPAPAGDLAYIAFGDRVEARARPWAPYINDLQLDPQLVALIGEGGTQAPRPLAVEPTRGGIVVHLIGSGTDLARAVQRIRVDGLASVVDLRPLLHHGQPPPAALQPPATAAVGLETVPGATAVVVDHPAPAITEPPVAVTEPPLAVPPADASPAELAARLSELTRLPDGQLARLFPGEVHRETYQRWRTGRLGNPTHANRRRLGLLLRLLEPIARGGVRVDEWLRNPTPIDDLSPYELLVDGRIDEVERLAADFVPARADGEVLSGEGRPVTRETGPPRFVLRSQEPVEDLVLDDGGGWEEIEDDPDDDA